MKRSLSITAWAALVWSLLAWSPVLGGCEPDARNDAHLFLDRVQQLDLDDSIEERRRMVNSLASLPLTSEPVQQARDACVEAYRTILEAEERQARARGSVEQHEDESAMSIAERRRIEDDIRESRQALERSRELFPRCHRLTRDLQLRYRSRRARGEG